MDKNLLCFLEDVCSIQDKEILNSGIWSYIIKNPNYPKNIICDKKLIFHKSSCAALFDIFKNQPDFCIRYKKLFHCDICDCDIKDKDEISSPIFSIDDEDIQLNDINSIFRHRYTSYVSGCSNCISNNIESNAYVLISNIILPIYFIVAIEFEGLNPETIISQNVLKKAQEYSKKLLVNKIKLEYNNKNDEYHLKGFIAFNNSNIHYTTYIINDKNFGDEFNNILKYDDLKYVYIK